VQANSVNLFGLALFRFKSLNVFHVPFAHLVILDRHAVTLHPALSRTTICRARCAMRREQFMLLYNIGV
jgi:hypothetical protein